MNQLDIIEQKKAIRREIKEIKKRTPLEKLSYDSDRIFMQVESMPQFKAAKFVLAYWSLPDEVNTHDFVLRWISTKKVVLPIVVGDVLELREFSGLNALVPGSLFGIQEPHTGALVEPSTIDFAIIPGIAFDTNGNRLGRGKGYYDKILTQTNAFKVAVGFDFQIVSKVPVLPFDIPVDVVISTIN
jgi:5-formyltetrahydrofolate cyclo-ligase